MDIDQTVNTRTLSVDILDHLFSLESLEAVMLFGSIVRADFESESDLDILVVSSSESQIAIPSLSIGTSAPLDLAVYTRTGIERITAPPSLFAWHLKSEGQILFDRTGWITNRLENLPPYNRHSDDLAIMELLF